MKAAVVVSAALGVGVAIALLTGLVPTTPPGLVGAVWYGFPLPWLYRLVLAPQYYPWRADFGNLLLDAVVWVVILLIVMLAVNVRPGSRHRS